MKINKLKSFTLGEMMVVMVITVIVVGLAFSVLTLVQKQMWIAEHNFEERTQVNLLRQSLWIDFTHFSEFNYYPDIAVLEGTNAMENVRYRFEKNWVIKEQDTFFLEFNQKTFYFDGQMVESGKIDALELRFLQSENEKIITVFHKNTASEYMQ